MSLCRLVVGCTALGLIAATAVAAQTAGARTAGAPRVNETMIDDLDEQDPPFVAYTGVDYRPGQKPAPRVMVEDISSIFVETPLECAVRCNDDDFCNSAAYYGENPVGSWPRGFTCLLRVISVPCKLPPDLETTALPDTILLLAQDEECEEESVLVPLTLSDGPVGALAPLAGPLMMEPMDAEPIAAGLFDPGPTISPTLGPTEVPVAMFAPESVSPAAAPVESPPATFIAPPGGLIRNFDVSDTPDVPVSQSPNTTTNPPPSPINSPVASAPELAEEPAAVDDYGEFELGALPPGQPGVLGFQSSGTVSLQAFLSAAAATAVVAFTLA